MSHRAAVTAAIIAGLALCAANAQEGGPTAVTEIGMTAATGECTAELAAIRETLDELLATLTEQGRWLERSRLETRVELARDRQSVAERVLVETTREWDALETEGVRLATHLEELVTQVRGSDLDEDLARQQVDAFNSQTALLRKNLEGRQQQVAERLGELAQEVEAQAAEVERWRTELARHEAESAGGR